MELTKHVGVVAIIISKREEAAPVVNKILTEHGDLIVGRLGLPYGTHSLHVISLIVAGTKEQVEGLVTSLRMVPDTVVESTLSSTCME